MDKISDILNSVKERLSNPFFLAFILAWMAWNPTVTVALLWYDPNQISLAGYTDIFDLIEKNTDKWKSIFLPLISAILYTGLFRNGVMLWTTFSNKWGDWLDIKLSKDSSIPMSKYLSLKDDYDERTKLLETVIKDESKTIEKFNEEHTERLKAENRIQQLENDRLVLVEDYDSKINMIVKDNNTLQKKMRLSFDLQFLSGVWRCTYHSIKGENFLIQIMGDKIYLIEEGKSDQLNWTIKEFAYDTDNKRVWFSKHPTNRDYNPLPFLQYTGDSTMQVSGMIFTSLEVKDYNTLMGTENGKMSVTYTRLVPDLLIDKLEKQNDVQDVPPEE